MYTLVLHNNLYELQSSLLRILMYIHCITQYNT